MAKRFSVAQIFLISGCALALLGFTLWHSLGIPTDFPPYLPTALLALVYGLISLLVAGGKA